VGLDITPARFGAFERMLSDWPSLLTRNSLVQIDLTLENVHANSCTPQEGKYLESENDKPYRVGELAKAQMLN